MSFYKCIINRGDQPRRECEILYQPEYQAGCQSEGRALGLIQGLMPD